MGADDLEFQIYLQFSFFDAFPVMWNLKWLTVLDPPQKLDGPVRHIVCDSDKILKELRSSKICM
jgi:hypothetical protein